MDLLDVSNFLRRNQADNLASIVDLLRQAKAVAADRAGIAQTLAIAGRADLASIATDPKADQTRPINFFALTGDSAADRLAVAWPIVTADELGAVRRYLREAQAADLAPLI